MTEKYIVTFSDKATQEQITKAKDDLKAQGGKITNEYDMPGMKGFAGIIPDSFKPTFDNLQGEGVIDGIEPDGEVTTQ